MQVSEKQILLDSEFTIMTEFRRAVDFNSQISKLTELLSLKHPFTSCNLWKDLNHQEEQ